MDSYDLSDRLCDIDELHSIFEKQPQDDMFDARMESFEDASEWLDVFEDPVLNDPMMTQAASIPVLKSEHSYYNCAKLEREKATHRHPDNEEDITTAVNPSMLVSDADQYAETATIVNAPVNLKKEHKLIVATGERPVVIETRRAVQPPQSLLRQNVVLINTKGAQGSFLPRVKIEPTCVTMDQVDCDDHYMDNMPITPPSSIGSDSEGGQSPRATPPSSPIRKIIIGKMTQKIVNPVTSLYSQPIPTSGVLVLSEEERRTFLSEGYPLPSKLPLSKTEEKNLKKVRRKIKNKISAQESRRKKKEYVDHLEKSVEDIVKENNDLRRKCETFENSNRSLLTQLSRLQALVKQIVPHAPQMAGQAGTCVLVLVLCFAIFIGNWNPIGFGHSSAGYTSLGQSHGLAQSLDMHSPVSLRSRTLTALAEKPPYCTREPWPVSLAKRSFLNLANFIIATSMDNETVSNVCILDSS